MEMAPNVDVRGYLQRIGVNIDGKAIERREYTLKDTVYFGDSVALVNQELFRNAGKPAQYQDGEFPIPSQGFFITHIGLEQNINFTLADAKLHGAYLQYFMNNSYLEFKIESTEHGKFWLRDIISEKYVDRGKQTAIPSLTSSAKFNNYYKPEIPIQVGAGRSLKVRLVVASNLTTAAGSATDHAYLPDLSLTSNFGHSLYFYLKTFRFNEA